MAQVDIQAGPFRVVSLLSREAVDDLDPRVGSLAVAVIKSTTVTVERAAPTVAGRRSQETRSWEGFAGENTLDRRHRGRADRPDHRAGRLRRR